MFYILQHFVNYIVSVFQFTSGLCLANQLYSKNMFILFKSITTILILSMYSLISSSSSTNLVASPFLVLSALKTLNNLSIGSIFIHSSFTCYLLKQHSILEIAEMLRKRVQRNLEPTEKLVDLESTKKQSQSGTQRKIERYYYSECMAQTSGHCKK